MARTLFLSSAHTSPATCPLSDIGGDFVLESVVRCAAFVRYLEFGGCPLFGSRKCTASTGIAVGTSTVGRYSEEVRYWEGPLSEVPLYSACSLKEILPYIVPSNSAISRICLDITQLDWCSNNIGKIDVYFPIRVANY